MVTGITYTQGSTDEDGSDEGNEGDPNEDDSIEEEGGESDEEGGATTPVTPTEPSAEEESNDNDNNNNDNNEPLPYCDSLGASEGGSYHDIDDIDEESGKFPCNDGTQRANKVDCPDTTKPTPLRNNPSFQNLEFGPFSVQGSSGPAEQAGPIPVPKSDEAVLKAIYDDEWSWIRT